MEISGCEGEHGRKITKGGVSSGILVAAAVLALPLSSVEGRLADRSRVVAARAASVNYDKNYDGERPIGGPVYRAGKRWDAEDDVARRVNPVSSSKNVNKKWKNFQSNSNQNNFSEENNFSQEILENNFSEVNKENDFSEVNKESKVERALSSQLTGCCYDYAGTTAAEMCEIYGHDCESGETPSHDSGDEDCSQQGLSFIGISFSVNTASGHPYSYQLCDQFPMENIIDRNYDYVMSMDEDGWLVGGGYKTFDYSGKMPYIDSSHTELLRVGSIDPDHGGTSIETVYEAMESISFAPFSIYPEYLKGGGGHHSGDDNQQETVPSVDITLIVSIVETYEDNDSYSSYEYFLDELFQAMNNVGGGPCMDDDDTDPHVSMARGVKFKSSYHYTQYMAAANTEIAAWQGMYPQGVPIGSSGYAAFPPGRGGRRIHVGYGNLYFFFDRANITKAFAPSRDLTDNEAYYATLYKTSDLSDYYENAVAGDYGNDKNNDQGDWEHNPYAWDAKMAMHDMTDGWDLPPNCEMEGETFFGIPLSRKSESGLQSTSTLQNQFDFEYLVDRNNTYIKSFGTNHGWLVGEQIGNGAGSIVDKDTAHIPIFYTGTTNADMGGVTLSNLIKIAQNIDFGTLYIKPAFVFVDDDGHVKLQFEVDTSSALAYLYDVLCQQLGLSWNYESPSNNLGIYTNCAMHAAGDRAKYGCGPDGSGDGGFCPQMTLGYSVRFASEEHAAAYLDRSNNYVDYWRGLYPSGVAVGTDKFCPSGGCLGLFLNRYDLYSVFKPDLGGSWVEYNGMSMAPTISPAPTYVGGCDNVQNFHLDLCFRRKNAPKPTAAAWKSLGTVGQFSVLLISFMAVTLSLSIFLSRARKKRRKGEGYLQFFIRDMTRRKKRKKGKKKLRGRRRDLEEPMINEKGRRSKSRSGRSRSKSKRASDGRSARSARSGRSGRSGRSVSSQGMKSIRSEVIQEGGRRRSRSGRRSKSRASSRSSRGEKERTEQSGIMDFSVSSPQSETRLV